jgi:PAS domain S-box-containing protein
MDAEKWPADSEVGRAARFATAEASPPSEHYLARAELIGRRLGLGVALCSLVVVVAWFWGYRPLVQPMPASPPMHLGTAIEFGVLGLLTFISSSQRPIRLGIVWHLLIAALVVVSAILLVAHLAGTPSRITTVWPLDVSPLSGRLRLPSVAACSVVILLSAALELARRHECRLAQGAAILGALLSLFSLNTYALGTQSVVMVGPYDNMAVTSAALALALAFAVATLTLSGGPLGVVASTGEGGSLIRRVLPGSVLGLLGIAAIAGQVITRSGTSYILVFSLGLTLAMFFVSALIHHQANALRTLDARRTGAEEALAVVRELMRTRDQLTRELDEQSHVLRQIIETSPDGFVSMDEAGLVTDWNPAAEAIFGWNREEVIGLPLHQLIVPDFDQWVQGGDFPDRVGSIEAFQARSKDVDSVRKDGTRIRVDLTLWPATEEPSRAYYAFARDVTVRRDSEERLLEANADLREFAAIAAHDLRNPLVAIRLAAEMLAESTRDGVIDEQGREWIGRIQAATLRGQDLISDLLEYSSLSSGPRETSRVDLTRLVEEVADQVAVGTDRKLAVEVGPLPVIEGDLPRLRQLFANLFSNAAKYVPRDRPAVVTVSARTGRRMVRIIVSDNGDGIADRDKGSVFGAFQRGSAHRDTPGTGIGLAICRKVAERHGGTITVEDSQGGGATFVVELPRWPGAMTIGLGGDVPTSLASRHGL